MTRFVNAMCSVIIVLLPLTSCDFREKLHVTVYYETLCPDSQRFVAQQLYPAWRELKDHLTIKFVPFGKSASDGLGGFRCQHGERECQGNMMQSCALSLLTPYGAQMEFVYCVMSSPDGSREGKRCSEKVGISWAAIESCMTSGSGAILQRMEEEETLKLAPTGLGFVPTITFNKKYNQRNQREALSNFRGVACRYLTSRAPVGCQL